MLILQAPTTKEKKVSIDLYTKLPLVLRNGPGALDELMDM
jgi:hypothetical protein